MGNRKYITLGLFVLFAAAGLLVLFTKSDGTAKDAKLPTTFRKDGVLEFVDAETRNVIHTVDIEMADEFPERQQGLKYRKKMKENQGMFFLFPVEEPLSFWMQDTPLSLDIIYVNSKLEIVSITRNTTPFSEDQILSDKPAQYVVEVVAGFCERHDINVNDLIRTRGSS